MEEMKRQKLTVFLALQAKPGSSGVAGAGSRQGDSRCEATVFHQAGLEEPGQGQCMVPESLELLGHSQRKGFGLRKEWSGLQGKGLWGKDNPSRREVGSWRAERLWRGRAGTNLVSGNQNRSTGGWEGQEGSEMRWVGAGMSGVLRELDSTWIYSFPGIPSYIGVEQG